MDLGTTVIAVAGVATAVFTGWAITQRWAHAARPRWKPVTMTGIWRSEDETSRRCRIEIANIGDAAAYDVRLESRRPTGHDDHWRTDMHRIKVDSGEVITWEGSLPPARMPDHVMNQYWAGVGAYFDMTDLQLRVTWHHRPGVRRTRDQRWTDMQAIQETLHAREEVEQ